ncbi:MAG: hypothetical protein ABGY24_12195 [bacterium]
MGEQSPAPPAGHAYTCKVTHYTVRPEYWPVDDESPSERALRRERGRDMNMVGTA